MKRILLLLTALSVAVTLSARGFDEDFDGATLRVDYVFSGNATAQAVHFVEALRGGEWAGRRSNLPAPLLRGNGCIEMLAPEDGTVLYAQSFSTLFQEWQATEEAERVDRGFENCFQLPFPKHPVTLRVRLYDKHGAVSCELSHPFDPADILVRPVQDPGYLRYDIHRGGDVASCVDIAILAEGYTAAEMGQFIADAQRYGEALLSHEPFASMQDRFNIVAVGAVSAESGVSIPHDGKWARTVAGSHFDTFYTDRYLTSSRQRAIYDALGGVPFEHIILLVNTPVYGGGGIYNSITLCSAGHPYSPVVFVHEFGHEFAGLGDEYYYDDQWSTMYPADTEPWEPNITTLVDFGSKWADLLAPGTPIPTPPDDIEKKDVRRIWGELSPEVQARLNTKLGVYEGGGYQSKGVYRPVQECRMKINECRDFCPVCTRAIIRMVDYSTR